jgi:glycine dehydrogenase
MANAPAESLSPLDTFPRRHTGSGQRDLEAMLKVVGAASLEELTAQTVPAAIRSAKALNLPQALSESGALAELRAMAQKNKVHKSFIGMGYYDTITPPVILRNIMENPGWYTQYTPYQAEISQGRLEALLNFQTMITDLTALPVANASMLDEATVAAEAMNMCHASNPDRNVFFVSDNCHPQTIAVVKTRAKWLGIEVVVGNEGDLFHDSLSQNIRPKHLCGILVQYPGTDGRIEDYGQLTELAHNDGILVVAATDLLALTLIKPPGEWDGGGADIAVGSAQRFGVPMGFGGPHAAFMACKQEFTRKLPGRIVGVSRDVHGNPAYRLSLQTREQHIRREKATSNICTAQVLLAIMASMYAVYHGPEGLKAIATRVAKLTGLVVAELSDIGVERKAEPFFDTIAISVSPSYRKAIEQLSVTRGMNFRYQSDKVIISLDETCTVEDVGEILTVLSDAAKSAGVELTEYGLDGSQFNWGNSQRTSPILTHPIFNSYHTEHEMLRYINRLQAKDLSLTTSMIPLGSCTMKLNATSEMIPVTWKEIGGLHPYAPADQTTGYQEIFKTL